MSDILVVLACIVIFVVAGLIYWRFVRLVAIVVQIGAFVGGIVIALQYHQDDETALGLLVGTVIYLFITSMVLAITRLGNLENEIRRLGGKPMTPDFVEFLFRRKKGDDAPVEKLIKTESGDSPSPEPPAASV